MGNKAFDSYLTSHFSKINDLSDKGFKKSAKFYRYFYKEFMPRDKNAAILDLGCGTGQFLYFLRQEHYTNFYGIDISEQQINFCKKNVTEKAEVADVFSFLQNKENNYDLISANDLIEHIPKNRLFEILELEKRALKPGGLLILKVPNMSNPFGLFNRYMDITHEVGFTEFSLSEVLRITGFNDIKFKGVYHPALSFLGALRWLSERMVFNSFKLMHLMQGNPVPKILNVEIIAVAVKK